LKTEGDLAEQIATEYLLAQGLHLIARNYHCRFGEIDLIMRDEKTLVFVEVRLRSHGAFGGAAYSITSAKQQKLILTAQHFLQQYGNYPCRFDALLLDQLSQTDMHWLKDAFSA